MLVKNRVETGQILHLCHHTDETKKHRLGQDKSSQDRSDKDRSSQGRLGQDRTVQSDVHLLISVSVQSLFSILPMPSKRVVPTTSVSERERECVFV